jgi:hypothetical protein
VKPSMMGVSALAVVLFGSVCVAADEAAKGSSDDSAKVAASSSEKSAKPQAAGKGQARSSRLTKPWRDMSSLTDEQKKQIADIHRKAVQDKNVIEEREKADIMALLNDQQKGELKSMQEKDAAEKKAKAANRPAAEKPAKTSSAGSDAGTQKSSEKSSGAGDAAAAKATQNKAGDTEAIGKTR